MRTLITFGLGVLTMYLLDPQQGRRRRALLQDQITNAKRLVGERAEGKARDLTNRAVRSEPAPDQPSETPVGAQHLGR
jgi:hypothetical protein